jgi:O-antigen ligase
MTADEGPPEPRRRQAPDFAGASSGRRLHTAERWLVGVLAIHLSFLPWALGDIHPWSQEIGFVLSALGFALALAPRGDGSASGRLLRFPIFWLGGAFLLYVAVQALNPAYLFRTDPAQWWMAALPDIPWLPHGFVAPFARANPWRCLMIDASAWMTVCALWAGLTRRASIRILLSALAANAFLLALLGILERASGTSRIYWTWSPPASYFVSSFTYKNHAGAYFDLMIALCAGLAAWHYSRRRRRRESGNLCILWLIVNLALVIVVVLSYSRAATFLLVAYGAAAALLLALAGDPGSRRRRRGLSVLLACGALAAVVGLGGYLLRKSEAMGQIELLARRFEAGEPSARLLIQRASFDLFRAKPVYGWGADGFRYFFPDYQRRYPRISWTTGVYERIPIYWEHAHNDYLEFLAECGIAGGLLAAAMLAWWARALVRARFWRSPGPMLLVPGLCVTLIHATGDFPFHGPSILMTWCALLACALKWAELERASGRINGS